MTLRRWYLIMLFMPLIFPAVSYVLAASFGYDTITQAMPNFLLILVVCSVIGAVPYFFFALVLVYLYRKKTAEEMRKISWWLPWIFIPVCALFLMALFHYNNSEQQIFLVAIAIAFCSVPVGFIYVFFVHILTRIAQSIRLIKE